MTFTVCAVCLVNQGGKFLLCKRLDPKNPSIDGVWEFPGGALESGEQPLEGVRREVREEVGVDLVDPTLLHTFTFKWQRTEDVLVIVYSAGCLGIPQPKEEHSEVRWVSRGEGLSVLRWEGLREALHLLPE